MTFILPLLYYNYNITCTKEEGYILDKVHIFSNYNMGSERNRLISIRGIIGIIVVFLLGRVVVFDVVAPFGLAFLSAYITNHKTVSWKYVAVALLGFVGTITSGADISIVKHMLAFVLFGLIYVSVTTLTDKRREFAISAMAGIAMLISGVIFSAQTGFDLYEIFMLSLESVLCVVSARLMQSAIPSIFQKSNSRGTYIGSTAEELAGLYLIVILCIFGLANMSIGNVDLGKSLVVALIMLLALTGGITGGTAGGVGIGVIYGISKFPMTEIVGVYSFCGLAAGLLRKFNKAGVIFGFFLANSILSLYLGGFDSGVFGVIEVFIGIVIFSSIPKSVILELENVLYGTSTSKTKSSVQFVTQKLNTVALAFSGLAKTFSEIVSPEQCENFADITTLYDKAADKVCRRCGLKFLCWEKHFNTTYDSMMKLAPILMSKDKVKASDIVEPFRSRCIKIEEFIAEINRVYGHHKLDMQWQQKVAESQELAVEQFNGMSKIMDNLVSEIDSTFEFDSHIDKKIIVALEQEGHKKCDATVIKNRYGRYEASIRLKKCTSDLKCAETVTPIVSDILKCEMDVRESKCGNDEGANRCEIYLVEKERYSIVCGAARRVKDGQSESGDNFNYMPICDSKYVMVLSDGMGSGKQAASQSNITVTMLEQLLGAGFDKQSAIKIINSALLIKTKEECFATIDITILDLLSGETEFIKIGANSSFIKHNKKVVQIKSSTLPAGILKDIDVETSSKKLENGDYIVMISDGIHSVSDNWITDYISKLDNLSPQVMADDILNEAVRLKNDCIDDDMTVMVAKLMEI